MPVVTAAGCAVHQVGPSRTRIGGPFFYPPPPAVPRIQHLLTLASERDLKPSRSSFADFIAGRQTDRQVLVQPYGVAMFDGRLYVADTGGPGLGVFDLRARRFLTLQGAGAGRMRRPINIAIDRDGTKYVTDTGLDRVLVFDRDDRFMRALGVDGQFRPVDVAIADERLFVVDILHHQVHVLDKRNGAVQARFGRAGSRAGELFQPTNLALGPDGDLYVAETGNFRVQRFTADGRHVRFYGEAGNVPGTFARPKGVAVDRAGRLYVVDAAFQNVQIFDEAGRLLMDFGRPLQGLDGLNLPAGIAIDYEHVALFAGHADARFSVEYVILVASQFGTNKVDVFGFGRLAGDAAVPGAPPR